MGWSDMFDFLESCWNGVCSCSEAVYDHVTEYPKTYLTVAVGVATGGVGLAFAPAIAAAAGGAGLLGATATTGTAISTLSGAALTNASLAALGGGALAAGGGGMAAGTVAVTVGTGVVGTVTTAGVSVVVEKISNS